MSAGLHTHKAPRQPHHLGGAYKLGSIRRTVRRSTLHSH